MSKHFYLCHGHTFATPYEFLHASHVALARKCDQSHESFLPLLFLSFIMVVEEGGSVNKKLSL